MNDFRIEGVGLSWLLMASISEAVAQPRGYGIWDYGPGMMPWGMMGWFGPIFMVVFWGAIIVALVFFIRWLMTSARTGPGIKPEDSALEILKKRYARGEIGKEEFEEKKKDLTA
jgi:putative membrane protein